MKLLWVLLLVASSTAGATPAVPNDDPFDWLGRIMGASQRLSYAGTFVYQSGGQTETSRIIHVVDSSGEREKIEALDGSPREMVRNNDEVKCFLPAEQTVIIDRQASRKLFPARLPASLSGLAESYRVRLGGVARVAGLDSRLVIIDPKDNLRYGHMLWADRDSGLLLKARMVNEKNEGVEQFYFTQVQIGGAIDRDALKPKFSAASVDWRVSNGRVVETTVRDDKWTFSVQVPGFKRSAGVKRQMQDNAAPMMHYVFSDGLAAISVFIEPLADNPDTRRAGTYGAGAINVYKRVVGDHALTLVGEVPARALKMLGDGIEPKRN
ncbi:MAG: MucB/RseB C-terminal domain-containing protein [Rhodocyclaceae bacterium]|jgi:sigma-E factor negative regulatory protein RseB